MVSDSSQSVLSFSQEELHAPLVGSEMIPILGVQRAVAVVSETDHRTFLALDVVGVYCLVIVAGLNPFDSMKALSKLVVRWRAVSETRRGLNHELGILSDWWWSDQECIRNHGALRVTVSRSDTDSSIHSNIRYSTGSPF